MKRLIQVIQQNKMARQALLRKIYEDYITKAQQELSKYFETYVTCRADIFKSTFYSVGIADINFTEGTVKIDGVWCTEDENDLDEYFREIIDISTVLESEFDSKEIIDFLDMLFDEGFEWVLFFTDDDHYEGKYPLYPFFRVG